MKGHVFLQRKIKAFSGTTEPVSTKLDTKHFRVKGIQVYSIKRLIFKRKNNRISAFNTWRKKSEIRKIKIVFIVWLQYVLQCFNSYTNELPMFKIEYLSITIFLSEWGYCVNIEIPLRLSPALIFRAL